MPVASAPGNPYHPHTMSESTPKKRLPTNLIILFCVLLAICVMVSVFMYQGFQAFNTYQPDTKDLGPSVPGFP